MRTPAAAAMHARRRHVRECRRPWDVGRTPCGATRGRRPPPAARPIGPGGPILFCPFHPLPVPCGGRQYHDQTALLEGYHMGKTESRSDKNLEIYPHARHLGGEGNLKWEGARLKPGARGEGNLKNKGGHNIIMLPKILVLGLGSYRFTKYGRFATKFGSRRLNTRAS
jgi:hypothetical protein